MWGLPDEGSSRRATTGGSWRVCPALGPEVPSEDPGRPQLPHPDEPPRNTIPRKLASEVTTFPPNNLRPAGLGSVSQTDHPVPTPHSPSTFGTATHHHVLTSLEGFTVHHRGLSAPRHLLHWRLAVDRWPPSSASPPDHSSPLSLLKSQLTAFSSDLTAHYLDHSHPGPPSGSPSSPRTPPDLLPGSAHPVMLSPAL